MQSNVGIFWTLVWRLAALLGAVRGVSWLFSLDPIILGFVQQNKLLIAVAIIVFLAFVYVWWDRKRAALKADFDKLYRG